MFTIEFDQRSRSVLVAFNGTLDLQDLEGLDDMTDVFIEAEGPHSVIFDFTGVTAVEITAEAVAARGRQPPRVGSLTRIIVTPPGRLTELAALFAATQAETGSTPPRLAADRATAFALIGLSAPAFRPVEIDWLRRAILSEREDRLPGES